MVVLFGDLRSQQLQSALVNKERIEREKQEVGESESVQICSDLFRSVLRYGYVGICTLVHVEAIKLTHFSHRGVLWHGTMTGCCGPVVHTGACIGIAEVEHLVAR